MFCRANKYKLTKQEKKKNCNKSAVKSAGASRRSIFPWQHTNKPPISVTMKLCSPAVVYNAHFLFSPRCLWSACEILLLATRRDICATTCLLDTFSARWRGKCAISMNTWGGNVSPDSCIWSFSLLPPSVTHSAAAAVLSHSIKKQKHHQFSVTWVEAHSIQGQAKNVNESDSGKSKLVSSKRSN